jgi:cytochrome c5
LVSGVLQAWRGRQALKTIFEEYLLMKKIILGAVGALVLFSGQSVMAADIGACLACHIAGVGGAPKASAAGAADWTARYEKAGSDANKWVEILKSKKNASGAMLNPMMQPQIPLVTADKIMGLMEKAGVK